MSLLPQFFSDFERIKVAILPPGDFITGLMQLSMVPTAERHCEFIADLQPDRARLCEAQMVRIGRLPSADKTRLVSYKF